MSLLHAINSLKEGGDPVIFEASIASHYLVGARRISRRAFLFLRYNDVMFKWISSLPVVSRSYHLWEKYEHYIGSAALTLGFCFDVTFASRPDTVWDNVLLLIYIFAAGSLIIILNLRQVRQQESEHQVEPFLLLVMLQFLFGNLSSNLLVLYGRSGTFAGSAIFIGLLLAMLVGNEFLKTKYGQLRFNIAVYYMLVFSYLMIAVPTFVLHDIGTLVFLATGAVSLAYISAFLFVVYRFVLRGKYRKLHLFQVAFNVGVIYVLFTAFYFLNIIPPVPLGLKDIGIYHSVTKSGVGEYAATFEAPPWFAFWRATNATYHVVAGEPAYCFSSVFAPTGLSAPIFHSWKFYNASTGKWQERSKISFDINGGRGGGYRGFTTKTLTPGQWRCDVETENGQLIGRTSFTAASGPEEAISSKTL